ncbi:MAG: J domain-containing protein [Polyangiaceae bacterium]|jgi:tetratricopeptide (TPR) repeat protein
MPPDDAADVDIDVELQRYVADACARLDRIDHYEILEVARDADVKAIKRAYFRLVGVLHPDRFFGKRLGPHKAGLLEVFNRVTLAYDELTKPAQRAAYDASLPPLDASAAARPLRFPVAEKPSPAAPDRRQQAMDALKQRFVEGKAAARQHAEAGARAKAAGDFVAAAEAYRAALRLTPDDAALKKALDEVSQGAGQRVAESRRKQALLEERYGHWAEAADSWRRVTEVSPNDAEARERLANAVARSQR